MFLLFWYFYLSKLAVVKKRTSFRVLIKYLDSVCRRFSYAKVSYRVVNLAFGINHVLTFRFWLVDCRDLSRARGTRSHKHALTYILLKTHAQSPSFHDLTNQLRFSLWFYLFSVGINFFFCYRLLTKHQRDIRNRSKRGFKNLIFEPFL